MRRREFLTLIIGATATWPMRTSAQQTGRLPTLDFWVRVLRPLEMRRFALLAICALALIANLQGRAYAGLEEDYRAEMKIVEREIEAVTKYQSNACKIASERQTCNTALETVLKARRVQCDMIELLIMTLRLPVNDRNRLGDAAAAAYNAFSSSTNSLWFRAQEVFPLAVGNKK